MIAISPVEKRSLAALAGIFSLRMLGLFMILPVFAVYATQLSHVTPTLVGVALGIYGLTQALLQIPFGFASDRFGRKPCIVFGLCLFIIGSIIAALSDSIYGVIIGRSLQGASAIGGVIMALATDLTREAIRVRAMAVIGITIGLSFGLSLVLGPLFAEWGGVRGLFWISAALSGLAIILLLTLVPSATRSHSPKSLSSSSSTSSPLASSPLASSASAYSSLRNILLNSQLSCLNFGVLVLHASLVAVFLKVPLAIQSFGFLENEAWRFYLPILLGSLIATGPCILFFERKQNAKYPLAATVLALLFSELGIYYFFSSAIGLGLSLWIFFTAFNTLEASLPSLVSKTAPSSAKGTALGIYSTGQFLGLFIGGLAGGWLDASYGMVAVLLFCIGLALGWLSWILQ